MTLVRIDRIRSLILLPLSVDHLRAEEGYSRTVCWLVPSRRGRSLGCQLAEPVEGFLPCIERLSALFSEVIDVASLPAESPSVIC
ncbi:hypothetical protein [Streptomyces sp. NPDC057280]|uniref:hypothetical protein n=1 Tax=Streptomyces sp. NPDC057280 TaxID=3346081 RepID=UPI00363E2420